MNSAPSRTRVNPIDMLELWIRERGAGADLVKLWPGRPSLPEGTVQEGKEYFLELTGTENPMAHEAEVDGVGLDALRPPNQNTARWSWTPGFYAGSFLFDLKLEGPRSISIPVTTDPNLEKLSRDQYNLMIGEILSDTMALMNFSSARTGVGKGDGTTIPPIARLEFLRTQMSDVVDVINLINRNPQRKLASSQVAVPYYNVRGVKSLDIVRSMATNEVVASEKAKHLLPEVLGGRLPAKIRQTVKLADLDIQEHREIKFYLRSWRTWLLTVAGKIRKKFNENPEQNKLLRVWVSRCTRMAHQFDELLKLPLFQNVSNSLPKSRMSSIYRRIGPYRRFFQLRRNIELGITNVQGNHLQVPLARTFDLYEIWVFLRLLRAAANLFGLKLDAISDFFKTPKSSSSLTVAAHTKIIELNDEVGLGFQVNYKEFWVDPEHSGSFSRNLRPDISLMLSKDKSALKSLIVLDAKYRIDVNLNEAISSIHTYRDALVVADEKGDIKGPLVSAAYLLSPQIPALRKDFANTGMPSRLFHPAYRNQFKFGAVTMVPGMSNSEVADTLKMILADAR